MNEQNCEQQVVKENVGSKRAWIAPGFTRHDVHEEVHGGKDVGADQGSKQAAS